jgi:Protein of unknown function (DUF2911)
MRRAAALAVTIVLFAFGSGAEAQSPRLASPAGSSAVEVGARFDEREGYVGGKWIEIDYGRPIRRGRDLFGPPDFVDALEDGAEVWRAGANYTTQLRTEAPLVIAGVRVEPGEYTVFIELGRESWTFILSAWPAQKVYDYENKEALFGAYYYTPDRDVVRAPMTLEKQLHSFEQLSWQFLDMTDRGGRLALLWENELASIAFQLPPS